MTAFKVFVFIVIVALALGSGIFMNGSLDKRVTERAAQKALITEQTKQNIMEQFKKEDVVVGQGQEAKSGDTLAVHYAGTLADGTKFDSSYDHGEPIEFKLGAGDVITATQSAVVLENLISQFLYSKAAEGPGDGAGETSSLDGTLDSSA